jgi:hypothetical protein
MEIQMLSIEPEFMPVPPEMQGRIDRFFEEHADDPIGNVGSRVIFEDDRVRIWELILEPGQASDLHHHECDYYLLIFEGDLVAGIPPKSTGIEPFLAKIPEAGNTVRIPKGGLEWAFNVGEKTYREVLVEYKDS